MNYVRIILSRSERKSFEIEETKRGVYSRYGTKCVYRNCLQPATELAHILPQDGLHIARFGEDVIHHVSNMRPTCQKHNSSVQINYRGHPEAAEQAAAWVLVEIRREERGL